jgi:RHH-type proline utilization regulon transcriptional repressor/proline dehydrogenase/delta 1-pyrroline-5-carboxylate dehydrogenase
VGPTAKAGGHHYVNSLRRWAPLTDATAATELARRWWTATGSQSIDRTGLAVEKNFQRYRRHLKPICIRVDDTFNDSQRSLVDAIVNDAGIHVIYSAHAALDVAPEATIETLAELVARAGTFGRVRWLSMEIAPTAALLEQGVSTDVRALSQRGDVEMARWLLEQSVSITHHRYGNVNAGPKPACEGLAGSVLEG